MVRDTVTTLIALVADALARQPDREAVIAFTRDDCVRWTRSRLWQAAEAHAQVLLANGVRNGERVALQGDMRPGWIAALLGTLRVGACIVPIDAQFSGDTLAHVLRDCGAHCAWTDAAHAAGLPASVTALLMEEAPPAPVSLPPLPQDAEVAAAVLYTSGTTGFPKGVPLTHRNLAFQVESLAAMGLVQGEDRALLPLPAHHVYPFALGIFAPLILGLPLIIPAALTGPQIARALRESEASVIIGVPRLYGALFEALEARLAATGRWAPLLFRTCLAAAGGVRRATGFNAGRRLFAPLHRRIAPRLRVAACGGAALDAALARCLEALGWDLAIGYGLTETSPLLTIDRTPVRHGSVGRPLAGVEIRVRDSEIQARGPGVFSGYLNLPEKNAETFTGDGWFRTGDRGSVDADGYLFVQGRLSEIIVTAGGVNVQPEEVEAAFETSAFIREAALLPGDKGLALLVVPEVAEAVRAGREVEEAVRAAVSGIARGLASYQRPSALALTHEPLPRTRLGKLQRHRLHERFELARRAGPQTRARPLPPEQWASADRGLLDAEAARVAWSWLTARYPDRRLTPDTHLELELGIDSLGWIDLTLELGTRAGVELDDAVIARTERVRDLLNAAADAQGAGEEGGWLAHPERILGEQGQRYLTPLPVPLERLARALTGLNGALMRGLFRVRARGLEHLPPRGPYLLVPNHGSVLDPFALSAVIPRGIAREVHWAGITDMAFSNPIVRGFSRLAHVLPVDPRRGAVSSLALATAVLDAGKPLVWFPEGQRSPDGRLLPFKRGIGVVLEHRKVFVVPVVIRGANDAMPPGRRVPRRSEITVDVGEPVMPDELAAQGNGMRSDERITDGLHARLWAMCKGEHASNETP